MKLQFVAAALAAAAFANPALAQGAPAAFEGPRVEARVGYDRVNLEVDYDDGVDAFSEEDHETGVAYGAEFGYDKLVAPGFTLGAYAGVDFSTTDYCTEIFGNDEGCLDAGRSITLGLRAGTPLSPNILAYVKGGFSNGRVTATYQDFDEIIDDFKLVENRDGFHLGAGAEARLGKNSYFKIEYLYTDYDDFDEDFGGAAIGIEPSRHQVLTGLGLRF